MQKVRPEPQAQYNTHSHGNGIRLPALRIFFIFTFTMISFPHLQKRNVLHILGLVPSFITFAIWYIHLLIHNIKT